MLADIKNTHSPFGVLEFLHWNHPWNNFKYPSEKEIKKTLKLMKKAGIYWVRFDFLWQDIEARQGEFDFTKYDRLVELVLKEGINILGILDYSTDWSSKSGNWNSPPKDIKLFLNFVEIVVSRYKDKVNYWEVWNEPDSPIYWQDEEGFKSYVPLLKETYQTIKKAFPQAKVLNGGLTGGLSSVDRLYALGARKYFDILNVHIFVNPLRKDAIKELESYLNSIKKIMLKNDDSLKRIWITEIGCPGITEGIKVKNWWLGGNPTEKEQAEWLKIIYEFLLKDDSVEKVFWAFFRDCKEHFNDGIDYFGLVRWDFSLKPAYFGHKEISYRNRKSDK